MANIAPIVLFFFGVFIADDVILACRIYSIKRPGRLFNFWTFLVGAYSRWELIRGWALIKFSPFSVSKKFIL